MSCFWGIFFVFWARLPPSVLTFLGETCQREGDGGAGARKFNLKVALKYLISQVYSGYDLQGSNAVSVAKFCKSISIRFFFFFGGVLLTITICLARIIQNPHHTVF